MFFVAFVLYYNVRLPFPWYADILLYMGGSWEWILFGETLKTLFCPLSADVSRRLRTDSEAGRRRYNVAWVL